MSWQWEISLRLYYHNKKKLFLILSILQTILVLSFIFLGRPLRAFLTNACKDYSLIYYTIVSIIFLVLLCCLITYYKLLIKIFSLQKALIHFLLILIISFIFYLYVGGIWEELVHIPLYGILYIFLRNVFISRSGYLLTFFIVLAISISGRNHTAFLCF